MNTDLRTILVATDLSRPAFAAVRRGALIARDTGAKLELLHVVADSFQSMEWNEVRAATGLFEKQMIENAGNDLAAIVRQIDAEFGVSARAQVLPGKPFSVIAEYSETVAADLILVGAHGENLLLTPLLGTTAHRVLRLARKPVLLVKQTPTPEDRSPAGYRHVLIATDFAEDAIHAATVARRLFPGATATLFHAYQVPFEGKLSRTLPQSTLDEYRRRAAEHAHVRLAEFANTTGWSDGPRIVRHGPAGVRIREYAAEMAADLIVTGSEAMPRLQSALLGSVSLDLVTDAPCDVLLARR